MWYQFLLPFPYLVPLGLQYGGCLTPLDSFVAAFNTILTSALQTAIEDEGMVRDNGPDGSGRQFLLA